MKTIGMKIGVGFLSGLVMFLVIGTVSFVTINNLENSVSLVDFTNKLLIKIHELEKSLVDAETNQRGFLLTGEKSYLGLYSNGEDDAEKILDALQHIVGENPEQHKQLDKLRSLTRSKAAELAKTAFLRRNNGLEGVITVLREDNGKQIMDNIRQLLKKMSDEEEGLLVIHRKQQSLDTKHAKFVIIGGTFTIFIIFMTISVKLTRDIAKPLRELTVVAERLSKGDVSVDISVSDRIDEVGQLATSFQKMMVYMKEMAALAQNIAIGDLTCTVRNCAKEDVLGSSFDRMIKSLQTQITQIMAGSQSLLIAANEILTTTSQVSANASETSASVAETTTSTEETRQIANLVNEKTADVNQNSKKMVAVAEGGKQATDETLVAMDRIKEQMTVVANSIVNLSEQTMTIGEIITTVEDLSEQSNLLAVNASIEAAKAGDQGKGFGVVALEIKTLAEQSKEATGRVRNILTSIQKAANSAVMVTELGTKAVDNGVKQAQKSGKAITALAASTEGASHVASQITAASQQQLAGMDQIVNAMQSIDLASRQNVEGAKQLQDSSAGLKKLGEGLNVIVAQYQL